MAIPRDRNWSGPGCLTYVSISRYPLSISTCTTWSNLLLRYLHSAAMLYLYYGCQFKLSSYINVWTSKIGWETNLYSLIWQFLRVFKREKFGSTIKIHPPHFYILHHAIHCYSCKYNPNLISIILTDIEFNWHRIRLHNVNISYVNFEIKNLYTRMISCNGIHFLHVHLHEQWRGTTRHVSSGSRIMKLS